MQLLTPANFPDYELIDCGDFEKLERFGKYLLIRPEPQAVWDKKLSDREWEKMAHVKFVAKTSSSGMWKKFKDVPDRWMVEYTVNSQQSTVNRDAAKQLTVDRGPSTLSFRLALTAFKHVGIFPEQAVNWDYIYESVKLLNRSSPLSSLGEGPGVRSEGSGVRVLNLFAYTGGASLAAKAAGADVTHLDSIKQVVTWSKENMELSGLKDIRWVVEDALTFVKREVKRGKKYNGIILDPPAYGHGANGEKWKLEDNINEMMKHVLTLLDDKECFLVLNTYSLGFSSLIIENLLSGIPNLDTGELYLHSKTGYKLPLGVFGRFRKL